MSTEYLNNKLFEKFINEFQQSKREYTKYEFCIEDMNGAINRGNSSEVILIKLQSLQIARTQANKRHLNAKDQLALAFLTLCENIVRYAKFNLIDRDDAIQEGVMICFEKIEKFDPLRGHAFNYFTTISWNSLRQLYRTARNFNELKKKYLGHLEEIVEENLKNHKKPNTIHKNHSNEREFY